MKEILDKLEKANKIGYNQHINSSTELAKYIRTEMLKEELRRKKARRMLCHL